MHELTLKAPITTAADNIFLIFENKRYDISWESSASRRVSWNIMPYFCFLLFFLLFFLLLFFVFLKSSKIWNCRLLQIIGGAFRLYDKHQTKFTSRLKLPTTTVAPAPNWLPGHTYGLGAKSQNLSSVAPPGRKSWLLCSVRDMSAGLRNQFLLSFLWSIICKWPVVTVTPQTLKKAAHNIQDW